MSKRARIMERRDFPLSEIRSDDATGEISGYAAVKNQPTELWPGMWEVIRSGAFTKTLADKADVYALLNHNSDKILGRTKNGTLTLEEDEHGLRFSARPPDTATAKEVRTLIAGGFIDKASFQFEIVTRSMGKHINGAPMREVLEVKLYDVSPVAFPAYGGTSVTARAEFEADVSESQTPSESSQADPVPPTTEPGTPDQKPSGTSLRLRLNQKLRESNFTIPEG